MDEFLHSSSFLKLYSILTLKMQIKRFYLCGEQMEQL